jgi:hypothetical protein
MVTRSRIPQAEGGAVAAGFHDLLVFGLPMHLGLGLPSIRYRLLVGIAMASLWPLGLNVVLTWAGGGAVHTASAWGWLALFCAGLMSILASAALAWDRLLHHWPDICAMLRPSARADLETWFRRRYRLAPQLVCGAAPALLGVSVLAVSTGPLRGQIEVNTVSYVTVGWVSFLGGLLIYVLVLFAGLAYELERSGPLCLDKWEPASTLGIQELSGAYVILLILITASTGVAEFATTRVPGFYHAIAIRAFLVACPIVGAVLGVTVGILPQRVIYRIILRAKLQAAEVIDEEVGEIPSALKQDLDKVNTLVALRAKMMSTPNLPFRAPWLIPLVAGLLGPLVAFLLGQAKR